MFHHKYKDKSFSGVNCETSFPVKQVFLRNELSYERHGIFAAGGGQMPTQEKKSFPTNELPCQTESLILPIPAWLKIPDMLFTGGMAFPPQVSLIKVTMDYKKKESSKEIYP